MCISLEEYGCRLVQAKLFGAAILAFDDAAAQAYGGMPAPVIRAGICSTA